MGIFDFLKKKKPAKKTKPVKASKEPTKKVDSVKTPVKKKDLSEVYKILKEPHISEKATQLSDENKYTFKVFSSANKTEIKKAVSNLYGVKVKDVKIINVKKKTRMFRGLEGTKTGYKKAVVTLEKGHKIELMPH